MRRESRTILLKCCFHRWSVCWILKCTGQLIDRTEELCFHWSQQHCTVWRAPESIHNNESYSDSWTCGRVNLLAATKTNSIPAELLSERERCTSSPVNYIHQVQNIGSLLTFTEVRDWPLPCSGHHNSSFFVTSQTDGNELKETQVMWKLIWYQWGLGGHGLQRGGGLKKG